MVPDQRDRPERLTCPLPKGSFAQFFGETPSTSSGTDPGKLVEGRDSNPRPRHYEPAAPLKIGLIFNSLPRAARCDCRDEAQPSTTDSRKIPARLLMRGAHGASVRRGTPPAWPVYAICIPHTSWRHKEGPPSAARFGRRIAQPEIRASGSNRTIYVHVVLLLPA